MNLMFWKKKAGEADETETDSDKTMAAGTGESPEGAPARPGLAARLRDTFSALGQRLRRRRDTGAGEEPPGAHETSEEEEAGTVPPPNLKKRLIIGGALGAVVLLLAGIGFAAWKLLFSAPEAKSPPPAETAAHVSEPPARPAPAEGEMQAQLEALKKQNEEMARQLETLKNEKAQEDKDRAGNPKTRPESAPSSGGSNEVTVFSGKDPKAGAQALKQAIEEMNATQGGGKPRKPAE